MLPHSFRTHIATSNAAIYFMVLLTTLLWAVRAIPGSPGCPWAWGTECVSMWATYGLVMLTTYVIIEWNNQCQLLRMRSRMNSVNFQALVLLCPALHGSWSVFLPVLCLLASYFILFKAYNLYRPQGHTFHAFLLLSLGSLVFPPLLVVAVTLLFSARVQLRLLTGKPFVACLLGLALPYWIFASLVALAGLPLVDELTAGTPSAAFVADARSVLTWDVWRAHLRLTLPDYRSVPLWQWLVVGYLVLLGLRSVFNFVRTSYDDKINTRQFFHTMLLQLVPLTAAAAWFPEDAAYTLPLLIMGVTPFAARYFASSRERSTDIAFIFWLVAALLIALQSWLDASSYVVDLYFRLTTTFDFQQLLQPVLRLFN